MGILDKVKSIISSKDNKTTQVIDPELIDSNIIYMNNHLNSIFKASILSDQTLLSADFESKKDYIEEAIKKDISVLDQSSIIWGLNISNNALSYFMQIAEEFKDTTYKIYQLRTRCVVIISLSCGSIHHILNKCRFPENPIYEMLKQEVYTNLYPFYFPDLIESGILEMDKFVRAEEYDVDDDFNQELSPSAAKEINTGITNIVDISVIDSIRLSITTNYPDITEYINTYDIYCLAHIMIKTDISIPNMIKLSKYCDHIYSDLSKVMPLTPAIDLNRLHDTMKDDISESVRSFNNKIVEKLTDIRKDLVGNEYDSYISYLPLGTIVPIHININYIQLFRLMEYLNTDCNENELIILFMDIKFLLKDYTDFDDLESKQKVNLQIASSVELTESVKDEDIDEVLSEEIITMEGFGLPDTSAIPEERVIKDNGGDQK